MAGELDACHRHAPCYLEKAARRPEACVHSKAVSTQLSMESISTAASSECLLTERSGTLQRLDSRLDPLEGSDHTPSTGASLAEEEEDRGLAQDAFGLLFRRPCDSRFRPHRDALRRVPRMHDFQAVCDLGAIVEVDGVARPPAFEPGRLRRVPRSYNFLEFEGVAGFQSEMQAEDDFEPH